MVQKKRKVLHFITGLEVGGAETMLLKTLPHLEGTFTNAVCCIKGRGLIGKKLIAAGIPVFYLDLSSPFDIGAIFRFHKIIKAFKPSILVTYLIHADLFGRVFGRIFGVKKIICSQRGALLQWEFLRIIDRLTKNLVTQYIVQTPTAQKELSAKLHLPKEKFTIIPNGIDTDFFDNLKPNPVLRESLGIKQADTVIICVANLYINKGHKYLLEAFEEVFRQYPNTHLILAGEGPERENITSQIDSYTSKSNIHLLGRRSDIPELLKISHIFALPTFYEGMSNAIQEAMASSLAIISTDISENKDLLTKGIDCLLVPVKDSEALKRALLELLENETLLNTLGNASHATILESFSIQKTAILWKQTFQKETN
jgi:glycosyltransferase involved in cell wall biosynthesis